MLQILQPCPGLYITACGFQIEISIRQETSVRSLSSRLIILFRQENIALNTSGKPQLVRRLLCAERHEGCGCE